jgi:hypothetical protein
MSDLEVYGIDSATLERMYEEWKTGTSKSALERRYLGRDGSHGKLFTSLVRRFLNPETEERHPLAIENDRLRACCGSGGSTPMRRSPLPREVRRSRRPGASVP